METITKPAQKVDFRKVPLKGVFTSVQKRLKQEHGRDITIDAVHKAYSRGEEIVFKLVKEESEKAIKKHQESELKRKNLLIEKVRFENRLYKEVNTLEA